MEIDILGILKNAWPFFWQFWPIFAILLFLLILKIIWRDLVGSIVKHRRFKKIGMLRSDRDILKLLRGMNPTEFEEYTADLFTKLGYKAYAVGRSHDGGIDVIAEKDGIKHYIQCKKFITSKVSVGNVRDFYGAITHKLTNGQGYFITTNKFTLEAQKFAKDEPIELIDGFKLVDYIRLAEKESGESPVSVNKIVDQCPLCEGKLVERKGKFGSFYGCSNYPKCKYTAR